MEFVERESGPVLRMLSGQVSRTTVDAALSHFEKLCEEVVGGRMVSEADVISCVREVEAGEDVGELDAYVDEFHSFVNDWRRALDRPVEIVLENRLPGGWSEVSSIAYSPEDDEYSIYVRLYSVEYAVEPEYVEDVREETIEREERVPHLGVVIRAEGGVVQNPDTDEFVGVGEAWASIPRGMLRSVAELREIYREVVDLADRVADEAQEELIIPALDRIWGEEEGL